MASSYNELPIVNMATAKLQSVMTAYSTRIHRLARRAINHKDVDPLVEFKNRIRLNPIHHQIGILFLPDILRKGDPIEHIPLLKDTDIGVYSKLIIWPPLAESDTHSHPSIHCFFTPIQAGLAQSIIYESLHYGDIEYDAGPLVGESYEYIHDSIGAHRMKNQCKTRTVASYHVYIQEDAFRA